MKFFDPNQPRDDQGEWTLGGGGASLTQSPRGQAAEKAATPLQHSGAAGYHATREKALRQSGQSKAADAHVAAMDAHLSASDAGGEAGNKMLSIKARMLSDAAHASEKKSQRRFEEEGMPNFNNQWIEIFRAGDYGAKGNWTGEKLSQVVENFKAGAWKPPAVLGHPQDDSPAMGWVEELALEGGTLKAKFGQVQPQLEAHVSEGRFPNRSAAFYLDAQGKGPVLRHVGFLGATPPEVKGLETIKFSDGEFVAIEFDEKEEVMDAKEIKKTVSESVREFFAELFSEKAGSTFSEADMNAKIAAMKQEMQSKMAEDIKALTAKFDESVKKAGEQTAAAKAGASKEKVKAFIEGRRAAGQWVPAFDEAGLPAVLEHLALEGGTVKFGETGKEKEVETYDLLAGFFEKALPAIVPMGALKLKTPKGAKVLKFNEARGIELNEDSVALANRAEQIATERKINFGEALRAAREELGGGAAAAAGGMSKGTA